jgi:hypothetical protein
MTDETEVPFALYYPRSGLDHILLPFHITSCYRRQSRLLFPNGLWWGSTRVTTPNLLGGVIELRTQSTEELVHSAPVEG